VLDVPQAQKSFRMHSLVPLGDKAQVEAHFDPCIHSANRDASGCTVCVKCTIGSEIALDTPNATPWWYGSCGISLVSLWRLR
jgi:hypothetical protein